MGVTSNGNPFGVPEGLFCSFPVHCRGDGQWAFAEGYRLPEEAERQLEASIAVSTVVSGDFFPSCQIFLLLLPPELIDVRNEIRKNTKRSLQRYITRVLHVDSPVALFFASLELLLSKYVLSQ